ncbi:MAG: hypothetical protein AAFU77_15305 [Myxococcota bacterium]
MRTSILLLAVLALAPKPAAARDLDEFAKSTWYLQIDFERMRKSEAGSGLYTWVATEVFKEIREETGVELDGKLKGITAWSDEDKPPLIVMTGSFSSQMKDAVLGMTKVGYEKATHRSMTYYRLDTKKMKAEGGDIDISINGSSEILMSFAVRNRVIVTFDESDMKGLLETGGEIPERATTKSGLIVLSADEQLLSASAKAEGLQRGDDEWQSNILNNTRQVAFAIAEAGKDLLILAELEAKEPELAESIANIVRGLVGLSYFNEDMGPAMTKILRSLKVKVDGGRLRMSVTLNPATIVSALED